MTPSFNREGLFDFDSKSNALKESMGSNKSKVLSGQNIILGE